MKILTNGKCICNSQLNYFYIDNTTNCQTGCPACNSTNHNVSCYYRDYKTATCVNPPLKNCSAPYLYADTDVLTNTYGSCVQNCGVNMYAIPTYMKCTSSCSQYTGFYNYKGATVLGTAMWTCVTVCPYGLILDLTTSSCVTQCPYYSGNSTRYFLLL